MTYGGAQTFHGERKFDDLFVPNPAECREHFAAGRLPVYHGRQLVAYVDAEEDLPEARFVERDGRLAGMLNVWEDSADVIAAEFHSGQASGAAPASRCTRPFVARLHWSQAAKEKAQHS